MIPRGLFLTGYRATGKTTIGRSLAQRLGVPMVDLDQVIQQTAGQTIAGLFDAGGEVLFRDWESRCLADFVREHAESDQVLTRGKMPGSGPIGTVVSLGGGAILREQNRQLISQNGTCIFLTATPETIWQRLSADDLSATQRPALTELSPEQEIASVLAERMPLYEAAADFTIQTDDRSVAEIVDEIWKRLRET
ncbi:MAG: shikimate kinase [Planctomycetota bacterium]